MDHQDDTCIVCCRPIAIFAVGICNHPVCHECSTRMRVLCKQNECPICRQEMSQVIFTHTKKSFPDLSQRAYTKDERYLICFEDESLFRAYEDLLAHKCKICYNSPCFETFKILKDHTRYQHERFYCDLCVDNLKIFTFERKCYTRKDLARHRRIGDPDQTSHRGHPLCKYCDERYLDNDELYRHLRREHFFCHFCDVDGYNEYYSNYEFLRNHFREQHYLCEEGSCREEKFTAAFRSEIDLKAHRATLHSKKMSKAEAKQARTLELEFTFKPRHQQNGFVSNSQYNEDGRRGRRDVHQRGKYQFRDRENKTLSTVSDIPPPSEVTPAPVMAPPVNMQSEEDFPQLNTGGSISFYQGSVEGNTLANRLNKSKGNFVAIRSSKPSGSRNINIVSEEDFPRLESAQIKIPPLNGSRLIVSSSPHTADSSNTRKTLLLEFNNHEHRKLNTKYVPNVSIEVSHTQNPSCTTTVTKANESNKATDHKNITVQAPGSFTRSKSEFSTNIQSVPKKVSKTTKFEEEFPSLNNKDSKSSVVIPVAKGIWSNLGNSSAPPSPPSAFITVNCKSKKKKQKANAEVEVKPSSQINEPNKKKKKEPSTAENISNTNCLENQENKDPLENNETSHKNDSENNKERNDNFRDSTEDLSSKTQNLVMEDFPPLPTHSEIILKAPPGFQATKSRSVIPPPGFFLQTEPTPTQMSISLTSIARQTSDNSVPSSSVFFVNSERTAETKENKNCTYVQPPCFAERNKELVQLIQNSLAGNHQHITKFKGLSALFRLGNITAKDYYGKCLELIGKENFLNIFPELLVLLPDITKQQELLSVYSQSCITRAKTGGAIPKSIPWNKSSKEFMVCSECRQVLVSDDHKAHLLSHSLDGTVSIAKSESVSSL